MLFNFLYFCLPKTTGATQPLKMCFTCLDHKVMMGTPYILCLNHLCIFLFVLSVIRPDRIFSGALFTEKYTYPSHNCSSIWVFIGMCWAKWCGVFEKHWHVWKLFLHIKKGVEIPVLQLSLLKVMIGLKDEWKERRERNLFFHISEKLVRNSNKPYESIIW